MVKGYYRTVIRIKPDAEPVDGITKFSYTDEDHEEIQEWVECSDEQYAETIEADKREEFLSAGPNTIAEQDDAICALYEENLALKSTAADQDDAICYLYEQMTEDE